MCCISGDVERSFWDEDTVSLTDEAVERLALQLGALLQQQQHSNPCQYIGEVMQLCACTNSVVKLGGRHVEVEC